MFDSPRERTCWRPPSLRAKASTRKGESSFRRIRCRKPSDGPPPPASRRAVHLRKERLLHDRHRTDAPPQPLLALRPRDPAGDPGGCMVGLLVLCSWPDRCRDRQGPGPRGWAWADLDLQQPLGRRLSLPYRGALRFAGAHLDALGRGRARRDRPRARRGADLFAGSGDLRGPQPGAGHPAGRPPPRPELEAARCQPCLARSATLRPGGGGAERHADHARATSRDLARRSARGASAPQPRSPGRRPGGRSRTIRDGHRPAGDRRIAGHDRRRHHRPAGDSDAGGCLPPGLQSGRTGSLA